MPETVVPDRPQTFDERESTKLGARYDLSSNLLSFTVFSKYATLIRVYFYKDRINSDELLTKDLIKSGDLWQIRFSLNELRNVGITTDYIYYGYRVWGPNWPFVPAWQKGTLTGKLMDVDQDGNRFNPNKLLIDPYSTELSHDPQVAQLYADPPEYFKEYYGGASGNLDTGRIAPKSILFLLKVHTGYGAKPKRALKDDIIYEVNLRGLTKLDEDLQPPDIRGTYKGAGEKAKYLKELGITAVEFLPVQEFADDQNDDTVTKGDNYWGYMPINYFSPNRRYSSDTAPGGPTREFQAMVKAFHEEGIKVFLDVVYNHTGEGLLKRDLNQGNPISITDIHNAIQDADKARGDDSRQFADAACYLSYAGLDNQSYYLLRDGNQRYEWYGGCGGNLNYDNPIVMNLIIDSLRYWSEEMGVDGFRFDLAPILSLTGSNGSHWPNDHTDNFNKISNALPSRLNSPTGDGVDLIAEPWGAGGVWTKKFPPEWSVWNEQFRDRFKTALNKYGVAPMPVKDLTTVMAGSDFIRQKPWNSINYLVSHDDCNSLRNIFSYNGFWHLDQAVPKYDQGSWDQQISSDPAKNREAQRKAVRNAFTLLMLSAGVPMFAGGDELFREILPYPHVTIPLGKMNLVSVDLPEVYLNFINYRQMKHYLDTGDSSAANALIESNDDLYTFSFVKNLILFRNQHEALRRQDYFTGKPLSNGLKDITWYTEKKEDMSEITSEWEKTHFIAFRINTFFESTGPNHVESIYCAYNIGPDMLKVELPTNVNAKRWYRVLDTDNTDGWMTKQHNFDGSATTLIEKEYWLHDRSVLVLAEK